MPANRAKATLIGYLGRDVEMRYMQSGNAVANVSIAVTKYKKNTEGQFDPTTSWFRVTAWTTTAERMNEQLFKGAYVYVECDMEWREWQDDSGNKKQSLELTARDFVLLEKRRNESEDNALVGTDEGEQGQAAQPF